MDCARLHEVEVRRLGGWSTIMFCFSSSAIGSRCSFSCRRAALATVIAERPCVRTCVVSAGISPLRFRRFSANRRRRISASRADAVAHSLQSSGGEFMYVKLGRKIGQHLPAKGAWFSGYRIEDRGSRSHKAKAGGRGSMRHRMKRRILRGVFGERIFVVFVFLRGIGRKDPEPRFSSRCGGNAEHGFALYECLV